MAPCTLTGLSLGPVVSLGRRVMFIIVIEALVIMVIVASTIGPMAVALLGGCFCALIGHLVLRVLILDEKTIESSLIMKSTFTAGFIVFFFIRDLPSIMELASLETDIAESARYLVGLVSVGKTPGAMRLSASASSCLSFKLTMSF